MKHPASSSFRNNPHWMVSTASNMGYLQLEAEDTITTHMLAMNKKYIDCSEKYRNRITYEYQ